MLVGKLTYNVLRLGAVADFEARHCQPAENLTKGNKFRIAESPPLL
jgi:hypothetical protein